MIALRYMATALSEKKTTGGFCICVQESEVEKSKASDQTYRDYFGQT
ncbi:MAG: hypothetical protein HQK58_12240 [Deltaproteobacteria bacterium]|nr:hypothetical protein [Deltaproteobacteria bacterium]